MKSQDSEDSPHVGTGNSALDAHVTPTSRERELDILASWKLRPQFAGTDVFRQLVHNEFKEPDDHARKAADAVRQILQYAVDKIPYYRELFAQQGLRVADFATLEDLGRFPELSRVALVREFARLQPAGLDLGKVKQSRTTGSTALPVTVLHTLECQSMYPVLWQRLARWFRLDLNKRFARIRIPPDLFKLAGGKHNPDGHTVMRPAWLHSGLYFETGDEFHFNVSNSREAQLRWLEHYRPAYLLTFPGLLEELALANDCKPLPGTESLIAISSILTQSMRSRITQAFGIPVNQPYGLNEIGLVATRCEAGRYHVNVEHVHVEVVDPDGLPAAPGTSGRILVTGLNNMALPLIRYDTGDLATATSGPCPCGRTLPSFANILGRYIRFAGTPEGTRPRLNGLLKALADMPNSLFRNIRQYQIVQSLDCGFELKIVASGPLHPEFRSRLHAKWQRLDTELEPWAFTITQVDSIEATPSGKQLDFVSEFQVLDADFAF